ncbi:MAG TPA: F0F1 ATP synthase subunit B [Pirellulales bacterium]|jgi:F-type H+-transporting ATPase subunit b|nr:F0F1 ATP synthase subunit B [Pirellulales bacterium]
MIRVRLTCAALVCGIVASSVVAAEPGKTVEVEHAGHAAGHSHLGMPEPGSEATKPSELRADLAVWSFVIFLLLVAVLSKFAWGPIAKALDAREKRIADDLAAARHSNEEARQLLAQYENRLATAGDEVRGILDEGRRAAMMLHEEMLAKARADATAEMDRAKREVETARDQALQQLAQTSANLAVELAGKIVRAKLNAADHASLIEDAVRRFTPVGESRN